MKCNLWDKRIRTKVFSHKSPLFRGNITADFIELAESAGKRQCIEKGGEKKIEVK